MAGLKEGDRVQIRRRDLAPEDREAGLYEHMQGLTGVVANVYDQGEVAVMIDIASLPKTAAAVHAEAQIRMRERFKEAISDEQYRRLSKEERRFNANYVHLVQQSELEKIGG
jgi:hypothetical protein